MILSGLWKVSLINWRQTSKVVIDVVTDLCDVDELCIGFKGRHKCKCYNKDKPNKWRFKAFCVNDSVTGCLFDFYLYGGKNEDKHGDVLCEASEF